MHTKFFIGTRVTPELKALDLSSFTCIPHEGKEYVGRYLFSDHPNLQEIRTECDQFLTLLQKQCPDFRVDTLPIVVFPQLFVG